MTPAGVVERRSPHDLTDEQVEVWRSVVNDAVDHFSASTAPLPAQLCLGIVRLRLRDDQYLTLRQDHRMRSRKITRQRIELGGTA
jgi:hypothetical protein